MNENVKSDLSALRVLRRAASYQTMIRAAQGMGVKAEAVRERIKTLERRVGKSLLRRSTRRCTLTAEGRTLLEGYQRLLQEELDATRRLLQPEKTKQGGAKSPGARFDLTLRCLDDGQWVAVSRPLELVAVSTDLIETLRQIAQELVKSLT